MTPVWAILLAGSLAAAALLAGWLTLGGALAALAVGSATLLGAGAAGGVLLATFFLSGSILTVDSERRGLHAVEAKGSRRDASQVLANGAWAGVGALILLSGKEDLGWAVLAGSLAAAQADTWATEIGCRAAAPPRLITTWQPVERGASGAISVLGTSGGLAGAAIMAALAYLMGAPVFVPAAAFVGGVLGMATDSLLGATLQGAFHCPRCNRHTEHAIHSCGGTAELGSGLKWVNNDAVNLLASGTGAAISAAFLTLFNEHL